MNRNPTWEKVWQPVELAHLLMARFLEEGDQVIDATAGNGYDTVFLAECVGSEGKVLAFDVQEAAIVSARKRVEEAGLGERVGFFQESHARMGERAEAGAVAAVMFNLGYLPGGDHAVTTGEDTLAALECGVGLVRRGGAVSVMCYPGHPEGAMEAKAVEEWITRLGGEGWRVVKYQALGTLRPAPFLLFAVRG